MQAKKAKRIKFLFLPMPHASLQIPQNVHYMAIGTDLQNFHYCIDEDFELFSYDFTHNE